MKTEVKKHEISFVGASFKGGDLYKLTISRSAVRFEKKYVYYFKGSELDELVKQIKEVKNEN